MKIRQSAPKVQTAQQSVFAFIILHLLTIETCKKCNEWRGALLGLITTNWHTRNKFCLNSVKLLPASEHYSWSSPVSRTAILLNIIGYEHLTLIYSNYYYNLYTTNISLVLSASITNNKFGRIRIFENTEQL